MNKRFYIISLLILTNSWLLQSAAMPTRTRIRADIDQDLSTDQRDVNIYTLDQIHQLYAGPPTNDKKAQAINYILDNSNPSITIADKISQAKILAKIINNDISLHSGWIYNDPKNQPQIDWLYEQQTKIYNRISQLQWQAKSFGEQALWTTAKWATIYLGIILAAHLSQGQLSKITGKDFQFTYGDLAWMPIEKLLDFAKNAVIFTKDTLTGETAQQGAAMALAMAKTAGNIAYDGLTTIGTKGKARLGSNAKDVVNLVQSGVHNASKNLAEISNPTPPS